MQNDALMRAPKSFCKRDRGVLVPHMDGLPPMVMLAHFLGYEIWITRDIFRFQRGDIRFISRYSQLTCEHFLP